MKHGFIFQVKIINEVGHTYFGCPNWRGLCKAYRFQEDMKINFDLGDPEDDLQDNTDVWMDVDMILVLPPCEFVKQIC